MTLTELESRVTPAAFDPAFYAAGFEPIPGWAGPVVTTVGDFDGNGSVDTAYAAGPDGAPRVRVYSGGRVGEPAVLSGHVGPTVHPGEIVYQPAGAGDVIYDDFVFEPSFRGGADVSVLVRPGRADLLVFTPGAGGGPRVRMLALDGSVDRSFFAFDNPDYRGGLHAAPTTVHFEVPAQPERFGVHLLVMPKGSGGGPVVAAYDEEGTRLAQFLVGPADDRREYRLLHADVDVFGTPGRRGLYVVTPDGRTAAFDWTGRERL